MQLPHDLKLPRPSVRHIIFGGVGGGLGVLGLLFGVALYLVETLIRPKKLHLFDNYTFSPYEFGLPAEAITFAPQKGDHKVSGWYIPHPHSATTILVCPGYRSRKSDMLGIVFHLWQAGHSVLAFEYYGHGTDVGTPVTLGFREVNDFLGAVAFARTREPEHHLGVVAYSMGAAVAIMCSASLPEVEALVADSAFATHLSVVDYNIRQALHLPSAPFSWLADYLLWWRAGYHFRQVEPLRDIARIAPRPILLIHGGKDRIVDPHDASLLYAAAQEPKELWLLPNADHCGAYFEDRKAYVEKLTGFFATHLKNRQSRLQLLDPTSPEAVAAADHEALEATTAFLAEHIQQDSSLSEAS